MRTWETQKAIYETLTDADIAPVYDHTPQEAVYPYIMIGEADSEEFDTDDTVGAEHIFNLHVWSRQRGSKETRWIQRGIYEALHRQNITVEGANLVTCEIEFENIFLDDDGLTRHGTQRLRVLIDEVG